MPPRQVTPRSPPVPPSAHPLRQVTAVAAAQPVADGPQGVKTEGEAEQEVILLVAP